MAINFVEKFGRVFIKKSGSSEYELLKSASFSNLDLKWYDVSGDIHSKYHLFNGKKFALGFSIDNMNVKGETEKFDGRFNVPLNIGEITGPDFKYLELASKTEFDLVKEYGLITGEKDDEMTELFLKYQGASGFFLSERKLLLETPLPAYIAIVNILDDICDELSGGMAESRRQIKYQQMRNYFRGPLSLLKGNENGGDSTSWENVDIAQMFQLPNLGLHAILQLRRMYQCSGETAKSLKEEALKFGTEVETKPFFEAAYEALEGTVMEGCKEWANRDFELFADAQESFKNLLSGSKLALEGSSLLLRIRLSEEIRSSWLFGRFRDEVCSYGRKLNDILSYNKEMLKKDAGDNQVYILHVEKQWPLKIAMENVLEDANQCLKRIQECGKILLEMFENDGELIRYIEMTKELIAGGFPGLSHTTRYHDNFVFDCYVEEDPEEK